MKTQLLIDYLSPDENIGITEQLDKIKHNINQVEVLKKNIAEQKKNNKNSVSFITVLGRWIIFFHSNLTDDKNTSMHFFEYSLDTKILKKADIFSDKVLAGIEQTQLKYYEVFNDKLDTFELSFAEPFEKVLKPNLFLCDIDDLVLHKAKELGVLPMIEKLKKGDRVKVVLIDEKITIDNNIITNIYALIHFGGHSDEQKNENGFAYIKLFDLINNIDKIVDFQKAIEGTGGKFNRASFMERFTKDKLN